jgi:DNA-directed RNA polymerase subunit F
MGAVFRPKDFGRGYPKFIENAVRDLTPDTKYNVLKLFNSWEGTSSKEKLNEMLGPDKAKDLLKKIKAYDEADLTDEERNALKAIFKDSLTFD